MPNLASSLLPPLNDSGAFKHLDRNMTHSDSEVIFVDGYIDGNAVVHFDIYHPLTIKDKILSTHTYFSVANHDGVFGKVLDGITVIAFDYSKENLPPEVQDFTNLSEVDLHGMDSFVASITGDIALFYPDY